MKYLLLILSIAFLASCSTAYHCKRCPIQSKDSTITLVKDSIIETIDTAYVSDSTNLKLLVKCDSLGNAYLEQISYIQGHPNVKIQYKYLNNQLSVNCEIDSLQVYNKIKTRFKQEYKYISTVKEKPAEKYIPKFFIWLLIGSLLLNVLFLGWKFLKSKLL